ncbi:uncharacterized protein LOC126909321 [Daktulosphaira vitifoliae]|uniref:uncharacterized protein LOC126908944 n=1 Tax=Daktulosphaira vitifoliae TaxID=58002 RepID=UPI0021AA2A1A|nr:uncharacterized protein LOC126908944 [Daktulosphaira vitifoliae]XP_050547690.1 uncharacterized protein LOC126909321 [Daktulosphaira vitifoliae]
MSSSKTVLKGNINFYIPYDDSLIMDLNFAILDKIGGWKDNALVFEFPNACSSSISLLEYPVWEMILKSINVTDFSCPIKEKNYVMHDLDMDSLVYTVRKSKMFPKTFFYGSYKAKYILKKKNSNTQVACFIIIVDVARPWEDTYHYQ